MSISAATYQSRQTEVAIVVPMLPAAECSPNFHGSWRKKAAAVGEFRDCAGWAAITWAGERGLGGNYWVEELRNGCVMDVEIAWCCGRKRMDDDNAWASLKACRDGIADVLFGGEDRFITQGTLTQTRGDGTVTVTLRPAS